MKKYFLLLGLVLCSFYSYSQVEFGIKGGINFSGINLNLKNYSPDDKTGFYIGNLAELKLNRSFSTQAEVLYSREGVKDGNIDYLNIPLLLKFFFVEGLHVNAGGQLGILLNAEGGKEDLEPVNVATVFGVGYEIPGGFLVDARYALGVYNIVGEDAQVPSGMGYNISGFQGLTRALQVGVGYKF